jgi:hypothetical protein
MKGWMRLRLGDGLFVFAGEYYLRLDEIIWKEEVRIEGKDFSSFIIHELLYFREPTATLLFEITSVSCNSIEFRMTCGASRRN